jgi:hypothetical protein
MFGGESDLQHGGRSYANTLNVSVKSISPQRFGDNLHDLERAQRTDFVDPPRRPL